MKGRQRMKLAASPDTARVEALFSLGIGHLETGDLPSAEACFREVIQIAPKLAVAHSNLGVTLEKAGALEAAEACYRRALTLDPRGLQAHLNLGALLVNQKQFDQAEQLYHRAMKRFPDSAALWSNQGALHACLQQEEAAEHCCRRALALDSTHAKARYNLSYLLLRQGRFEEGWQALEARSWNLDLLAKVSGPRWQGESVVGKSVLIGCEGGYGDMIQFCRYACGLKAEGAARIGIVCQPALKRLFQTLAGVDVVVALGELIPEPGWDVWTLPLSIPLHRNTRLDSIPAPIPYLQAQPDLSRKWSPLLPPDQVRVGLVWKGNTHFDNDDERSLPHLGLLAPLVVVPGVRFVSLQKGAGEAEAAHPPPGLELLDPSASIEDFADTAALIANLDLVISVDTATAHLAGALGKPCWVLLPYYKPDWRWFKDREDSPWYPGLMRLFRQPPSEGWGPVLQEVAAALHRFVQAHASSRLPEDPQG